MLLKPKMYIWQINNYLSKQIDYRLIELFYSDLNVVIMMVLMMMMTIHLECGAGEEAGRSSGFVQKGAVLMVLYSNARCLPILT